MKQIQLFFSAIFALIVGTAPAFSEGARRPAEGVQDNSFLIEEAYNQEPGVVQHIFGLRRENRDWLFSFTQEWPIGSQTHQFSYSVPYSWLRMDGDRSRGLGDVMLNYRWQALSESDRMPAVAPRFSLILPTGSPAKGVGSGSIGYQANIPFSKIIADRVTLHANVGLTSYWDIRGQQPLSYAVGGSAVYAVTRDFNLLFEVLAESNESVSSTGASMRESSVTIAPGTRYAINLEAGQLVLGAAFPIRFSKQSRDTAMFFYLSFEHEFLKR